MRNRPESPDLFSSFRIESGDESPHAVIAAGRPYQNFVFDYEWRTSRPIILVLFRGIRHIPNQMAGSRIQAEKMCIVCLHINSRMPQAHAAIVMRGSVVYQALGYWPRIMPDRPSCSGIQSKSIIC